MLGINENNINLFKRVKNTKNIFIITLLFWVIAFAISPYFRSINNINNILIRASILSLVAIGQMLVIITSGFDLSVGSIVSFSTCFASVFMIVNMPLSILGILIVTAIFGMINGLVISFFKIEPFVMTISSMTFIQGFCYLLRPGGAGGEISPGFVNFLSYKVGNISLIPLILLILIPFIVWIITKKSILGRYIYAIGSDENKSIYSGIKVKFIKTLVYAISGFTAGLAGLLLISRINCGGPSVGSTYLIDSITVVVLGGVSISGGKGNWSSVMAAIFIIIPLSSLLNMLGLSTWYQMVIKGLLLILVTGLQRQIKINVSKEV